METESEGKLSCARKAAAETEEIFLATFGKFLDCIVFFFLKKDKIKLETFEIKSETYQEKITFLRTLKINNHAQLRRKKNTK